MQQCMHNHVARCYSVVYQHVPLAVLVIKPTNTGAKPTAVYSSHIGDKLQTQVLPSKVYMSVSLLSG
jgi:hypothetical protein